MRRVDRAGVSGRVGRCGGGGLDSESDQKNVVEPLGIKMKQFNHDLRLTKRSVTSQSADSLKKPIVL